MKRTDWRQSVAVVLVASLISAATTGCQSTTSRLAKVPGMGWLDKDDDATSLAANQYPPPSTVSSPYTSTANADSSKWPGAKSASQSSNGYPSTGSEAQATVAVRVTDRANTTRGPWLPIRVRPSAFSRKADPIVRTTVRTVLLPGHPVMVRHPAATMREVVRAMLNHRPLSRGIRIRRPLLPPAMARRPRPTTVAATMIPSGALPRTRWTERRTTRTKPKHTMTARRSG